VETSGKKIALPVQSNHLRTISGEQLAPELVRKLPLEFLKKHCAIPITLEGGSVAIALSDPLNFEAYDSISAVLGMTCERVICPASEIDNAISRCFYQNTDPIEKTEGTRDGNLSSGENKFDKTLFAPRAEDLLSVANKAPTVKLVNRILFQALHSRSSDIHIEPYEDEVRIRFRVDGVLHNVLALPRGQMSGLASRLKIMANLNIAEQRLPQDGQSRVKIGEKLVDIRMSVIPTLGGERLMLRLLDKSNRKLGLDEIGFSSQLLSNFRSLINLPHGIILLTGPTGSGKTTTLYATINQLNSEVRNILTVEDPIEYQLPGVGQMQVKPKIKLTFASCLRHILRQDPDVIMIGEIRDIETAEIAIQASLTGHLVLSTLHTNDSASAVTRLVDMGVEPYLISSSVVAVMAQRLVRTICPECKRPYKNPQQLALFGSENCPSGTPRQLYKGQGCKYCLQTGYFGRTGIFELLTIDDDIRELILKRSSSHIIKRLATRKGLKTLREDGLQKVLSGETTLEEVFRVTQDNSPPLQLSQKAAGAEVSQNVVS
jgi:general secretion pathway protein E